MGQWNFFKVIVFISLFLYSQTSLTKEPILESHPGANVQLTEEDQRNFRELTVEERFMFLQRRAEILSNIQNKLERNAARVAWFQWTKGKVIGSFKPSTWSQFVNRVFHRHSKDLKELNEQQKLNYDRQALEKIFINDIMGKLDGQLIKNMKVLASSHEWTINLGAHLVTYAGFRKATAGLGMVFGVELGRSFNDKNVRVTPYVDVEFIRHAYIPMIAASIEALMHFTVNGNDLRETQRHQLISIPGGGNYINNDKMFGFGVAWGAGLPPIVDQFAFYRLSARRFRLFAKKPVETRPGYTERDLATAIPMCRMVFLKTTTN